MASKCKVGPREAFVTADRFRTELDIITSKGVAEEQWQCIETLRATHAHTIGRVESAGKRSYNCFAFAFQLESCDEQHNVKGSTYPRIFPDSCFVMFLLRRKRLREKPNEDREEGDVVVYWNRELPTHAGRVVESRVTSKWGGGLLLNHEMNDVPISYGTAKTYSAPSQQEAEELFLEYARCMGYSPPAVGPN